MFYRNGPVPVVKVWGGVSVKTENLLSSNFKFCTKQEILQEFTSDNSIWN